MNERIKELYEQAHVRKPVMAIDPETGNPMQVSCDVKPMYKHNEFNPEKFAELVIQESCLVGEQWADGLLDLDHYSFVNKKIKQYFGIKQ